MLNFDDFIEQVRDANPIEEVIEESGITLKGHGRLRTGRKHDSLKVRTDMQRVFWYSQNWNGDVFAWVMREKGIEFMGAVEILARRAHIEMPKFKEVNESEIHRWRTTADVFSTAAAVFHRWLTGDEERGVKADKDALAYVRGRGWTDETLHASLTGFSGRKEDWQVKDMTGDFNLFGINLRSVQAIAVLGFQGDVDGWAREQGIREHEDFDEEWITKGRIHGLMDTPGIIYAHRHKGGVRYLSRRQLPGFDKIQSREWKSFNPHKAFAGPKQPYFNHVHRIDRPLVLVEGQGDAITWGQWGQGAMAFCGLSDHLEEEGGQRLVKYLQRHPALYLQLDDDEAGQASLRKVAKAFAPKIQIVRMSRTWSREEAEQANEENNDAA